MHGPVQATETKVPLLSPSPAPGQKVQAVPLGSLHFSDQGDGGRVREGAAPPPPPPPPPTPTRSPKSSKPEKHKHAISSSGKSMPKKLWVSIARVVSQCCVQ